MKLFLDTNVWLRYFIADREESFRQAKTIIELAECGKVRVATSTFVLSEFVYVESSFYKIGKRDIIQDLEGITSVKNIRIIEKTDFKKSLKLFKTTEEKKWSDCVIVSQVPEGYILCSFDKRLGKLIGKKRFLTPSEVLRILGK